MTTLPITKPDTIIKPRYDAADIQRALNEATGPVAFMPGVYRLNKGLIIPPGRTVLAHGATIILTLRNNEPAHSAKPNATVDGGTWLTEWTGDIYSGWFGCAWRFGMYYADGFETYNVCLRNVCVDTNARWPDKAPYFGRGGNGILVSGGATDIQLYNISTPFVVSTMSQAVAGHWGCATRDHTKGTLHPSMRIDRLRVGSMRNPHTETAPISVSAMAHAEINDVDCIECSSGLVAYPGDYGYQYATAPCAGLITLSNYRVHKARWTPVLTADGKTDPTRYSYRGVYINNANKQPTPLMHTTPV